MTKLDEKRARMAEASKKRKQLGKPKDAEGFTDQERAFVLHYLGAANRIATDAALMAGWGKGVRGAARRYAYQVMQRPHIQAEIERQTEARNARLAVTADDVLRELLILKVDAEINGKSGPALRTRLDVLKTIGEHVNVGAFRRMVGLSNPSGGPIQTEDVAALARLTDEELDQLERARSILDRAGGPPTAAPAVSEHGGDTGGEGAAPQGE